MAALSYKEICKKIKEQANLGGVYAFFGDEDYTKADAVSKFRKLASESGFPEFNTVRFTASEFSIDKLGEAIDTPPMMSLLKLIEVDGADIFSLKGKEKDTETLSKLLCSVPDDIAVIFHCNSKDISEKEIKSSAIYNAVAKEKSSFTLVNCQKATPAEIAKWLSHRMSALGVTASNDVINTLAKKCSYSMFTLIGEVSKLAAYALAKGRTEILADDLDKVVTETVDVGAFDLTNAISDRRISDALAIYSKMKRLGTPPMLILGSIVSNFAILYKMKLCQQSGMPYQLAAQKFSINEYRAKLLYGSLYRCDEAYLKKALDLFSKADSDYKSLNIDAYTIIETLIASLGGNNATY